MNEMSFVLDFCGHRKAERLTSHSAELLCCGHSIKTAALLDMCL